MQGKLLPVANRVEQLDLHAFTSGLQLSAAVALLQATAEAVTSDHIAHQAKPTSMVHQTHSSKALILSILTETQQDMHTLTLLPQSSSDMQTATSISHQLPHWDRSTLSGKTPCLTKLAALALGH